MSAERLKEDNELFSQTNLKGDIKVVLPDINMQFDTIIVDPPKSGMSSEVCKVINDANFKNLIYISCNSATLVRDLNLISGLKIERVMLFDMFARTGEYETLVIANKN